MVKTNIDYANIKDEHLYKQTFESASVGICHVGLDGKFLKVNDEVVKLLGYSEKELLSMKFQDITHEKDLNKGLKLMRQILNDQREKIFIEKRYIRKDGSTIWTNLSSSMIKDENGRPVFFISILRDIRDLKKFEKMMLINKRRLEDAERLVNIGNWEMNLETNEALWSEGFYKILGLQPGEVEPSAEIGFSFIHPDDRDRAAQELDNAISEVRPYEIEKRIVRRNGEIRDVLSKGEILTDEEGNPQKLVGIFLDITERKNYENQIKNLNVELEQKVEKRTTELKKTLVELKRREKLLKENEEKYRTVFEKSKDGILLLEDELCIDVNESLVKMLGYSSRDELINLKPFEFSPEYQPDGINSKLKAYKMISIAKKSGSHRFEWIHRKKDDSEILMEIVLTKLGGGEKTNFLCIMRDVTEKKKAERALLEAKRKAEKADRAKSEFIANMSHEIRTPLNAVIGFSELLDKLLTDEKLKTYVDAINSSGNNLLMLINDILHLSKIEAGMMEIKYNPIDLKKVIYEMDYIFKQKVMQKDISFSINIDSKLDGMVLLDEVRIRQILLNIVGNAVKFTDQGFVNIELRVVQEKNNKLDIEISVEDTGIGIADEEKEAIFKTFVQQSSQDNRKYEGTGLGLSISKKLAKMMNGTISLESELGKGSIFTIKLFDVERCLEYNVNETKDSKQEYNFEGSKVLVVDDTYSNRLLAKEVLEDVNIEVLEADNGYDAVEIAKHKKPDLVLMDLRMPRMDGIKAAENLRKNSITKDIPILLLTASAKIDELPKKKMEKFDGYLLKPFENICLYDHMTKYLKYSSKKVLDDKEDFISKNKIDVQSQKNITYLKEKFDNHVKVLLNNLNGAFKFSDARELYKILEDIDGEVEINSLKQIMQSFKKALGTYDISAIISNTNKLRNLYAQIEKMED